MLPGPLAGLFVDADGGDYHLPAGSAAVDNGQTLASVPVDIEGTPRPQGPSSDVGAYERLAAVVPTVAIADVTALEGNAGPTSFSFTVTLSAPPTGVATVDYATADGTATSPADFQATSGTLSFSGSTTSATIVVVVMGEIVPEPNESFVINLTNPSGATIADGQATGLILNDDVLPGAGGELVHGSLQVADLQAQPGPNADTDLYRIGQKPRSSYEVVVDATSGDLGNPASPIVLERVAADLTSLLQASVPVGVGSSRSLSWENTLGAAADTELVRVSSGDCTTTCDANDTYRVRAWETTASISRFNNSATQVTVLVLENGGSTPVNASVWYWNAAGTLAGSQAVTLAPKATAVVNTSVVVPGSGGSITVSHDGRYGQLAGKAVAVEPATGFTFDTEMRTRPR